PADICSAEGKLTWCLNIYRTSAFAGSEDANLCPFDDLSKTKRRKAAATAAIALSDKTVEYPYRTRRLSVSAAALAWLNASTIFCTADSLLRSLFGKRV